MVDQKDRELFEIRTKMIEMSKALRTSKVRMDKETQTLPIEDGTEEGKYSKCLKSKLLCVKFSLTKVSRFQTPHKCLESRPG